MKIGICSTDFSSGSVDEVFARIHSFGFHTTQFCFGSIAGQEDILSAYDEALLARIQESARKYEVEICAINATFNMIDPNEARLRENIRRMDTMCRACRYLDCRILTLCTGTRNPENMWVHHPDNQNPESWQRMLEAMRQVVSLAEAYGIYVAVETEAANVVQTPILARRMLDEIHSDNLKMILDCANLFLPGFAHRENAHATIQSAFDAFGDEVILAHGKDIADSDGIEFAPVGEGIVDYDLFLKLLYQYGYDGAMVVHGIYKEELMEPCIRFITEKIRNSPYGRKS